MHIFSKDNSKIKQYIKLASSKKYRHETGLFVLEGARGCRDAFVQWQNNALEISACFATNSALEKYSKYIDKRWFEVEKCFYTIDEQIALKMSDSQYPQGIFVIAKMLDNSFDLNKIEKSGKYLILDDVQDPGNVGTLLRTAEAVGVETVVLCTCCDLYNPKLLRSSVGTVCRLRIMQTDKFSDVADAFKKKGVRIFATVVDENACDVKKADFRGGCAVVLGNEGNGMSSEDINRCDERITIRMKGKTNSLNVASAGSIFLWEMCRGDESE